jgi:hypothetical protein
MYGNFTKLNRQNGGQQLDVEGWLVWEGDDVSTDLTITVAQGATTGSHTVTVARDTHDPSKPDRWNATVAANGSGPWVKGSAAGLAGAQTTRASGAPVPSSWSSGPLDVK